MGEVFTSPLDVYLDETSNAVQPDIIVVLKDNFRIINEHGHIHGTPDLLVEILSPGNKEYDLIKKKDLYERFGVSKYSSPHNGAKPLGTPALKLCGTQRLRAS